MRALPLQPQVHEIRVPLGENAGSMTLDCAWNMLDCIFHCESVPATPPHAGVSTAEAFQGLGSKH